MFGPNLIPIWSRSHGLFNFFMIFKRTLILSCYPTKSENNLEVNDVLRFFQRNSPTHQFEGGQEKGGNFFRVA